MRAPDWAHAHGLIVLFDRVQGLDVTGPLEVFAGANPGGPLPPVVRSAPRAWAAAWCGRPAGCGSRPTRTCSPAGAGRLLRTRGGGARERDPELVGWLRERARRSLALVSVCTGAFLLAEAGLLDGRRVTTHWATAARWPRGSRPTVDPDPIFIRDGDVFTSAGVTAGIDLALALVEADLGRAEALGIARHIVVFLRRPGNQAQFSAQLAAQLASREPLRDVQHWITENPAADLSVDALATRASLSPRQFARAFTAEVGMTPGPLRRPGPARVGPAPPGGHRRRRGGDRPHLRLRHPRGHAPRLHPLPRRQPGRIPPPLPAAPQSRELSEENHADRHPAL